MAGEDRQAKQPNARERVVAQTIHAVLFDMDGVVTHTAQAHTAAWKRLFDEYLEQRASERGGSFRPFESLYFVSFFATSRHSSHVHPVLGGSGMPSSRKIRLL